jgi:ribosome recycling factor
MGDFRPADHAMGLELQIEELNERRRRATVQGMDSEASQLRSEIEALQGELAATADRLAVEGVEPDPAPHLHNAEELNLHEVPD